MTIKQLSVGALQTNCMIIEDGNIAVVIDPGAEPDKIMNYVSTNKLKLSAILLTHGHADHIGAVGFLREYDNQQVPVYCHRLDAQMLINPEKNLASLMGIALNVGKPDFDISEITELAIGELTFTIHHVPGHTPGHVAYYCKGNLFAGDTLFRGGIGRWDLPEGNGKLLIQGIKEKLLVLPPETIVWPGHGPETTIGYEKETNPYLADGFDPDSIWM